MTIRKNIISAAALSGIFIGGHAGVSLAGENKPQTIKPLQAISFKVGENRSIGYFYQEAHNCKLVLTLAVTPVREATQGFTVARFEAAVRGGQNTRYTSEEGQAFEFSCLANAEAMTFNPLSAIATQSE